MSKSYDEDGGVRMKQTCFFDLLLVVLLNETSLKIKQYSTMWQISYYIVWQMLTS